MRFFEYLIFSFYSVYLEVENCGLCQLKDTKDFLLR